jgi:hypothetical protein
MSGSYLGLGLKLRGEAGVDVCVCVIQAPARDGSVKESVAGQSQHFHGLRRR